MNLTTTNLSLPANIGILKDSFLDQTINLTSADTILYVDSLLPNHSYKFQSVIHSMNQSSSLLNATTLEKKDLQEIFEEIHKYYRTASIEERKFMIKTIIREIKIKLRKMEDKGEIDIYFREDGHIKKEWANRIVNPENLVSSYYLD